MVVSLLLLIVELSEAMFEAHHIKHLVATSERNTKLRDMALLCANCHRMIHRAIALEKCWLNIEEAKMVLFGRELVLLALFLLINKKKRRPIMVAFFPDNLQNRHADLYIIPLVHRAFQRSAACHLVARVVGAVDSPVTCRCEFAWSKNLGTSAATATERAVLSGVSHDFSPFVRYPI